MTLAVPTGRKFTFLFLALLAVGIGVSYSDSFGIGFYFDDAYGIANNPAIKSLKNIPSFFTDPHAIWTDHTQVDLRPFLLITYAVNYAISGIDPWSYHAVNLLLHLLAALLVFVIVRDHLWWPASERGPDGAARLPAAAAALFFALAPLNSQPVDYIWARSALLCVTLYLGAFLAYLRRRWARPRGNRVYHEINLAAPGGWSNNYRIPDLLLLTPERFGIDHNEYFEGAPDVVVEIRSPGDESYEKLDFYAQLGVPEVWIIERDSKAPEIYVLRAGRYMQRATGAEGWVLSDVTGIELRLGHPGKLAMRLAGDDSTREDLPED